MKSTIKNGILVDQEGFELYPNSVYLYGSAFRNVIENYPEGTEVEINNCWNAATLYNENARILYGSCLDFNMIEPTEEQSNINKSLIEQESDINGLTGNINNSESSRISDNMQPDSIQDESGDAQGIQGFNSEEHTSD